jgi:hypothetical protein
LLGLFDWLFWLILGGFLNWCFGHLVGLVCLVNFLKSGFLDALLGLLDFLFNQFLLMFWMANWTGLLPWWIFW